MDVSTQQPGVMVQPLVRVEQLAYAYPDGTPALAGVHLELQPGERVGLIGPSGSGKSTLLMCMSGLFAGSGRVLIEGLELSRDTVLSVRGRLGLIFQSPDDQLFMPTLGEDLAFGPVNLGLPAAEVDERVAEAAGQMGLTELLDRAPHHLSMGQRRCAAIAAVLALRPAVLLMDEPTSNLDPRSRRQLAEVLSGLSATMLIASHDLAFVGRFCSRVLLIDGGRIVAEGPSERILTDAELMDRHGLQA